MTDREISWRWRLAQWLELRWWQRYLRRREPADYLERKRHYWLRVLHAAEWQPRPGARALDAGCGPAGIFLVLKQQRVDAVDPLLEQYAMRLPHFIPRQYPWVNFYARPVEAGLPGADYDEIYCLNAINHVHDWSRALLTLTGGARPGTRLLLGIDVHRSSLIKRIFRLLPGDVLHPHQHDRGDYRRALHQLGWHVSREVTLKPGLVFDYWLVKAEYYGR